MNNYTIILAVALSLAALLYFAMQRELKTPFYITILIAAVFAFWQVGASFSNISASNLIVISSLVILLIKLQQKKYSVSLRLQMLIKQLMIRRSIMTLLLRIRTKNNGCKCN